MGPRKTYRVIAYQRVTALSTAVPLAIPKRAPDGSSGVPNAILMQAETQDVRWRPDGANPTTTSGVLLKTGALEPFYYDGDLTLLRFIEVTASAVLNIVYLEDVMN